MSSLESIVGIALVSWAILAAGPARAAQGPWNVVEAGAVGDGQTDCTAVFQRLLDEVGQIGGGTVQVPAGRYRIDGTLSIPAGVTLQGTYRVPPTVQRSADGQLAGSVLLAYAGRGEPEGEPFIRLAGSNASLVGFVITYPEWSQADVPPVPYPPCVLSENTENVGVQECLFLNPYEAIKLVRAHRHLVRNITGYPIRRGIYVDQCYDIGHIENIHFWPFGVAYDPQNPYCLWVNTNGVAFELGRTDWHYVSNTFCFGYGVGYRFSQTEAGSTNGNFLGLGADSCQRAVVVEQAQPPGLLITNGEFVGRWSSQDAVCLEILPGAVGKVSLSNCSFWGPIDRCVWMRSPEGQFTADACNFVHWDVRGEGSPAIQLDAGKAIIQGCTFNQDGMGVLVGEGVTSAILTANQQAGGFRMENHAGRRTQAVANEQDPIEWTEDARLHYRIDVGEAGDGRYLRGGWFNRERMGRTMRWSSAVSHLILPVVPGKRYSVGITLGVSEIAAGPDAGLYLGDRLLAPLKADMETLTAELPPAETDQLILQLRCSGWVPSQEIPGSDDNRTLGVSVDAVTMRAEGAGDRVFDANAGKWLNAP